MPKFKVASRTGDELKAHKAELNALFEKVKGANGKLNPKGVKDIQDARFEIAELIVQLLQDEMNVTDPTPWLAEPVTGDIKDDYIWQELHQDSALRVVARSYGSKPLSQRLFFKEFGITTSHKEVAVEIPLEDVAAGRITPALVVEQMAQAINRYKVSMVCQAIDDGVAAGADQTGVSGYTLRYTGFSTANLDKAIDGLQDEADSVAVLARHIAIAPVIRSGIVGDAMKNEVDSRGMIGTYHGASVVTLQDQYSRKLDGHTISPDRWYVAAGRKGAILMDKDVSFLNYSLVDERTATFATGVRLEDGVLVYAPYRYRIITRS